MHCSRQTIIVRGHSVQTIIQPTGFLNNWIADSGLTKDARHLYITLHGYTYGNKDHCYPRHKTIAERTGMSIRTVQKYLAELEAKGFICSEANKYSNTYYLLAHPCILAAVARQSEYQGRQTVQQGRQTARTEYNINNNTKYPPTPQRRPAENTGGGDFSNCKFFGKGNATNLNTMVTRALCTDFAQKSTAAVDLYFEAFFAAYPVKQAKPAALAVWQRLRPGPELIRTIMDSITAHKASDSRWQRGKIPSPDKWLAGQRWNDQPFDESNLNLTPTRPTEQVDYAALVSRPAPGFSLPAMPPPPPGAISYREFLKLQKEQSTC